MKGRHKGGRGIGMPSPGKDPVGARRHGEGALAVRW